MSDYYPDTLHTLPLFRRTDPDTSKASGQEAADFIEEHERLILDALRAGPGTKDELAERCRLTEQQVIRRMARLERLGLVEATGDTRRTASGRMATVWGLRQ